MARRGGTKPMFGVLLVGCIAGGLIWMMLGGPASVVDPGLPLHQQQVQQVRDQFFLAKTPSRTSAGLHPATKDVRQADDDVTEKTTASIVDGRGNLQEGHCNFTGIDAPLSGLEQELIRIWNITSDVMEEVGAVYWPTDGTLLGMMRNGRVGTDRDIDIQIHTTKSNCASLLHSLKPLFSKRCKLQSFKVVYVKGAKKLGRYAVVRMHRQFGTFSTGVDFNCVYADNPDEPYFYTHRGVYTRVPPSVYPLGKCLFYGQAVPCPRDGYAVLDVLKPRYEGCMVFPHCMGDPSVSTPKCLSPHPVVPLQSFVDTTRQLHDCGFTSLKEHYEKESSCKTMLENADKPDSKKCEKHDGKEICFIQSFKG